LPFSEKAPTPRIGPDPILAALLFGMAAFLAAIIGNAVALSVITHWHISAYVDETVVGTLVGTMRYFHVTKLSQLTSVTTLTEYRVREALMIVRYSGSPGARDAAVDEIMDAVHESRRAAKRVIAGSERLLPEGILNEITSSVAVARSHPGTNGR
jgi:hypothetical protein